MLLPAFTLVVAATVLAAPDAFAGSTSSPAVTFTSGPTVSGSNVTVGYSVNRQYKAVSSRSCSLANTTTNAVATADCGNPPPNYNPKTNPATYTVTLSGLANGTYTYTVNVTLTDGGKAFRSTSFTIAVTTCWAMYPDPDSTHQGYVGLRGLINTRWNANEYVDVPDCSTNPLADLTIVQAADEVTAADICNTIFGDTNGVYSPLTDWAPTAPADYWVCNHFG